MISADVAADTTTTLLRQSAETFLASRQSPARVRAMRAAPTGFELSMWHEIATAGWLGLRVPEEDGGAELGLSDAAALCELLGGALVPEPFIASGLMASIILAGCPDPARRKLLLPSLIDGSRVFAVAWQEAPLQLDAAPSVTQLLARDGRLSLSGRHLFVPSASAATDLLVLCRLEDRAAIVRVEVPTDGMIIEPTRLIDGSVGCTLLYEDVAVPPDSLVARGDEAIHLIEKALNEARLAASAWLVGLASRSLTVTLDYLANRVQFGRPIGSFQAIQHHAVDLSIRLELTKATVQAAIERSGENSWDPAFTSAAKASSSDTATLIARRSVQLHGGIGYADEADPGLYLKTALRYAGWLGNADVHRERFSEVGGGNFHA